MTEQVRCSAHVYKRDEYRYTGGGSSGFTMHYSKEQCSRKAVEGGLCWQHQPYSVERAAKQIARQQARKESKRRRKALQAQWRVERELEGKA